MSDDFYTKRQIDHCEAEQIAHRLINSHFDRARTGSNGETARVSIPANPDRDDDLLILAYIRQQAALAGGSEP